MIPKIIHYCWFGRNPKPKLAEKCIKSWRCLCPDYEIIEWNEDNYDLSEAPLYVRQAYEARKWAFVTDYVRLQVIYENGGIYMDTDVELQKNLDTLLSHAAYFGFENGNLINTGIGFGAEKGTLVLKEIMEDYHDISFVKEDGTLDLLPCPQRNLHVFLSHGLKLDDSMQILDEDILILPSEYLCPIDSIMKIRIYSPNTVSIHWFDASWAENRAQMRREQKIGLALYYIKLGMRRIIGEKMYERLKNMRNDGEKHA